MYNPLLTDIQNIKLLKNKSYLQNKIQTKWFLLTGKDRKAIDNIIRSINQDLTKFKIIEVKKLVEFRAYEEARAYCAQFLNNMEYIEEVMFILAQCDYGQGLIEDALIYIEKCLDYDSNKIDYWNLKADCLLEMGDWEAAATCLNTALRTSPANAEVIFRLGTIYLYHGQNKHALDCFSGCCKLKPFNSNYLEMKAELLVKLNKNELAIKYFQKAFRWGGNIEILPRLAYCYANNNQCKKAVQLLHKVLNYDANHYDALCNLGYLYESLGKYQQAYKLLKKAYTLNCNDPVLLNNLGYTSNSIGRSRKAIDYYKSALRIDPSDPIVLYNLGMLYYQIGKWQEAVTILKKLLKVHPEYLEGWALLGNVYEQLSEISMAVDCYNKYLQLT